MKTIRMLRFRRTICLIFCVAFFQASYSAAWAQTSGIVWGKDLGAALAAAKKSKKLVCVDVFTNW
ncbi:MAG: hypothetical protein IT342_12225 [Candidatus Melainabacteria bacterium]|nr:hypothetical protein [Candidatus Melainabacteria bacterium]